MLPWQCNFAYIKWIKMTAIYLHRWSMKPWSKYSVPGNLNHSHCAELMWARFWEHHLKPHKTWNHEEAIQSQITEYSGSMKRINCIHVQEILRNSVLQISITLILTKANKLTLLSSLYQITINRHLTTTNYTTDKGRVHILEVLQLISLSGCQLI